MVYRDGRAGHLVEQNLAHLHATTLADALNTVLIEARRAKRQPGTLKPSTLASVQPVEHLASDELDPPIQTNSRFPGIVDIGVAKNSSFRPYP
jgi:hypothetical protein